MITRRIGVLFLTTVVAAGCTPQSDADREDVHRPTSPQRTRKITAGDHSGAQAETPAALSILRERLQVKRKEEQRLEHSLNIKQTAIEGAARRLESLENRIRQATAIQREVAENTQRLEANLKLLRRQESSLKQHIAEIRAHHDKMIALYEQQTDQLRTQLQQSAQQVDSNHNDPALSASAPDDNPTVVATTGRNDSRAAVRRHVQQRAESMGCRPIEIRDGSRASGTVIRRAAAQGGFDAFWCPSSESNQDVFVKLWADRKTRIMYYKVF